MIKIKVISHINYPIIPNELKNQTEIYGEKILYTKDVIEKEYSTTGVWQDLPEEIIDKVYRNDGLFLAKYLKNIPKWIVKEMFEEFKKENSSAIVSIIRNPFFTSVYKDYFTSEELELLTKTFAKEFLESKQNPNFDVTKFVHYNKKENVIYYEDEVFDYFPPLYHSYYDNFVKYAEFTNENTKIKLASVRICMKEGFYKEAYKKAVENNILITFFGLLPRNILLSEFLEEFYSFIESNDLSKAAEMCITKNIPFPFLNRIDRGEKLNLEGKKYSLNEINKIFNIIKIETEKVKRMIKSVKNVFRTELKEIYYSEKDTFSSFKFYFSRNIVLEIQKLLKEDSSSVLTYHVNIPTIGEININPDYFCWIVYVKLNQD